ncbi:NADP-dependent oxidoreductase [Microtetraspora niveoalba]|uniref:NADP-dependent oxidoreductase n=1 Tax=Microtetraspora niveoalba TaxID=46175 RepID=UPI00083144C6|nr:NADP-dependent oxidoreductase [Microtetraspora niveoalba]
MTGNRINRINRAYRLRRRPVGQLTDGDLELVEEQVPELADGQALVRTKLLSLDPTSRVWMSDIRSYEPPVPIGAVMRGFGVGEVVASRREDMPVGATVSGFTGWQELVLADDSQLEAPLTVLPTPLPAPESAFLGVLGHTGISAYLGIDLAELKEGETIVISAACGAVGSIAGQIARQKGAGRVIGIAGSPSKCQHAVEVLGYDACIDHHAADWRAQLDAATPDGIDVDFENVGGPVMDHILMRLNIGARVSLCGMISEYNSYNEGGEHTGSLTNIVQLIMQRATIKGFLVLDWAHRFEEAITYLAGLLGEGKLHYDETIVGGGIEAAPHALHQLFSGANLGKLLVRVAD